MFTFLDFSAHRLILSCCPVFEINLSADTEVATTPRCLFASLLRQGNVGRLFLHQISGSCSLGIGLSSVHQRASVPSLRWCWDKGTSKSNSAQIPPFVTDVEVIGAGGRWRRCWGLTNWLHLWYKSSLYRLIIHWVTEPHVLEPDVQVSADSKTIKCLYSGDIEPNSSAASLLPSRSDADRVFEAVPPGVWVLKRKHFFQPMFPWLLRQVTVQQ